jgi:hypothetical protein
VARFAIRRRQVQVLGFKRDRTFAQGRAPTNRPRIAADLARDAREKRLSRPAGRSGDIRPASPGAAGEASSAGRAASTGVAAPARAVAISARVAASSRSSSASVGPFAGRSSKPRTSTQSIEAGPVESTTADRILRTPLRRTGRWATGTRSVPSGPGAGYRRTCSSA